MVAPLVMRSHVFVFSTNKPARAARIAKWPVAHLYIRGTRAWLIGGADQLGIHCEMTWRHRVFLFSTNKIPDLARRQHGPAAGRTPLRLWHTCAADWGSGLIGSRLSTDVTRQGFLFSANKASCVALIALRLLACLCTSVTRAWLIREVENRCSIGRAAATMLFAFRRTRPRASPICLGHAKHLYISCVRVCKRKSK